MTIKVITEFIQETTVRIRAYVYNDAGSLVDPTTSIKVTVIEPDGSTKWISAQAMIKDGDNTGYYDYYKQTDGDTELGQYIGKVVTVDGEGEGPTGAKTSTGTFSFKIKLGIGL